MGGTGGGLGVKRGYGWVWWGIWRVMGGYGAVEEVWHHMLHPSDSERIGWAGGGGWGVMGGALGGFGGVYGATEGA